MSRDEAWERAQREANAMPAIPMQFFLSRISFVMVLVNDMLDVHSYAAEQIVKRHTNGMVRLIQENPQILRTDTAEVREQVAKSIEAGNRGQVEKYKEWMLNQALVSFCTFLDAYLEDTVDLLLSTKAELLYDSKAATEISLKQVVEGGVSKALEEVRRKEVSRFAHLTGIKSRIGYLESKLGLTTDDIFDWSHFTDGDKYSHWDLDHLAETYDKRHSIVHHDEYPIRSIAELQEISTAFSKLIMNIGRVSIGKYDVMVDMNRTLTQAQLYQQYRSAADS